MLRLARSPLARFVLGWIFTHMSFILPVDRLYETGTLLAFYHPQPAYAVHILIVPKQAIANLLELDPAQAFTQAFLSDLLTCTRSLVESLGLAPRGYRLIANGGQYQDAPQLHFHLIAD